MKPILIDCTNALGIPVMYDRGPDGYGVPVPTHKDYRGTDKLRRVLGELGRDLKEIGWLEHMESMLTAGLYVNKKGAHGDGIAIDIDGAVLKPNPLQAANVQPSILLYNSDYYKGKNLPYLVYSMPDRIKTRFACLLSLRFGKLLTAGYDKRHEDHIHADLSRTVKWRGSRSQVVCLQETLNAWFNAGLKVDGKYGEKTKESWIVSFPHDMKSQGSGKGLWLDWLKRIAFNPPKDVNDD